MSEMTETTIRGRTYAVPTERLRLGLKMFDIARDGLGQFKGKLGRAAFLHLTARIAGDVQPETGDDPFCEKRFLRVLRAHLARRMSPAQQELFANA